MGHSRITAMGVRTAATTGLVGCDVLKPPSLVAVAARAAEL